MGHHAIAAATLLLQTTGRRRGATRTSALAYARGGDEYLLVVSNGEADRRPAWLYNLKASPNVDVQIRRERRNCTAKVIEPTDPAYERVGKIVNANNDDRYAAYQQKRPDQNQSKITPC